MRSIRRIKFVVVAVAGLAPVSAMAHNPQIQIGIANGKIVTNGLFTAPDPANIDYQLPSAGQRIFSMPMGQRSLADANDGWYAEPNHANWPYAGPGVALLNGQFAVGSKLTVTYLDGLKIWDGSGFVDPGTEQVAVATSATFATSVLTKDVGPFNGVTPAAVSGAADEHLTLRWRLLGDGVSPNTASDDGVYLLKLQLSTDQAGIGASDPYYFLLNKNASAGDQAGAVAAVTALVPEPGALGIVGLAGLWLGRRRRD